VVFQSNGYAAFAIMYLSAATLEFTIVYWLFQGMEYKYAPAHWKNDLR